MFRLTLAAFVLIPLAFSQNLPAIRWAQQVDGSGRDSLAGFGIDAQGNSYVAGSNYQSGSATRDVFVAKLDPSGGMVYLKHFGGSADDIATAMTVDPAGDVYVTGTTASLDFPVTSEAYASAGGSFLMRLNPDGSTAYSTYFSKSAIPAAIALDAAGSAYITGTATDGLPVTPGAYQSACNCADFSGFFTVFRTGAFASKFNPDGSGLSYSTYLPAIETGGGTSTIALAAAPDGSVYVACEGAMLHLDDAGTALLANQHQTVVSPSAMTIGPDGSIYLAGWTNYPFKPTPGAFQSNYQSNEGSFPGLVKLDSQLTTVEAATYFQNVIPGAIAIDSSGNVYIAGTTKGGLPTRTPIQGGFSTTTGFLSELSADFSSLLFSSYFGDMEHFAIEGLGVGADGDVLFAGITGLSDGVTSGPMNVWVNSLALAPPPALRIDAVDNIASQTDGPISTGETIVVHGAGFGSDAKLSIGGFDAAPIAMTPTSITAVVPQNVPALAAEAIVTSGGASSNQVLLPVAGASPGIFSQDGTGLGQGYILNQDGSLNTPSNPAKPNQQITVFANGAGSVSFTQGYAVTQFPVNVFVGGFYCDGVAAVMGPVPGFPGSVYQITVIVPDPSVLEASNPNPVTHRFPPLVDVTMQIDGVTSPFVNLSIGQ